MPFLNVKEGNSLRHDMFYRSQSDGFHAHATPVQTCYNVKQGSILAITCLATFKSKKDCQK